MTDTKPQKQAPQKHHGGKIPCMCTHTHRHTVLKQLTTENKVSNAVGDSQQREEHKSNAASLLPRRTKEWQSLTQGAMN